MPAIDKKRKVYFPVYPAQVRFLDATELYRAFVGGRGAGKTKIGCYDLIKRAKPKRLYLVGAPTYTVLSDATMRSFLELGEYLGVIRKVNQADHRVLLGNRAEVIFRSSDNPDRWRGPNLSGAYLDEASQMDRAAFDIIIACLREGGEAGWLSATFTPRGRQHWTFDVFGTGKPGTALIRAKTGDNPFLPEVFESAVRGQYTTSMAMQELAGEFIDPEGSLFRREWFTRIVEAAPASVMGRVRYWDKAGTEQGGAYTAGVLMSRTNEGLYTIEHVTRGQWSSHARNQIMLQTAHDDRQKYGNVTTWVEQEPGSGGKESAEITLREFAGFDVHAERATGDKTTRAMPFAAQCEAGNVQLVRGTWNADYVDELASFPDGSFADQTDASSGAFNKLALFRAAGGFIASPPRKQLAGFKVR